MQSDPVFVGIDVSKDTLEIAVLPSTGQRSALQGLLSMASRSPASLSAAAANNLKPA